MPDIACLNGTFSPLSEARISVNDRGFLFADGVYEVVRVYGNTPFRMGPHLDRLMYSLGEVRITPDWQRDALEGWIDAAIAQAGYAEAKVYIQVSRGAAPRDHAFPDVPPTTLITVTEIAPLPANLLERGAGAVTMDDIRWGRCDIKSVNLLANVLARQAAREQGAFEAIFVGRDGTVREGATSNLFAVAGGTVLTPPLDTHLLAGISRAYLLELCGKVDVPHAERPLTADDLYRVDELFLTGTTIEVLPVTTLNGKVIGDGAPGPITRSLAAVFRPSTHTAK